MVKNLGALVLLIIVATVLVSAMNGGDLLPSRARQSASTNAPGKAIKPSQPEGSGDRHESASLEEPGQSMWSRFRKFAEREEKPFGVIFAIVGTAAGIALGAASIWVSVQANRITKAQASLMQHQNALTESELRPLFRFTPRFVSDLSGERFELVEVYNDGGPIQVLESWNTDVLEVVQTGKKEGDPPTLKHIVGHYFGVPHFTGESRGLLCTLEAFTAFHQMVGQRLAKNNRTAGVARLRDEVRELGGFEEPRLHRFLMLAYRDALDREETVYFEIDEPEIPDYVPTRITRLPKSQGEFVKRQLQTNSFPSIGFEKLSVDRVLRNWDSYTELFPRQGS
jgi:hypothetical protein